MREKDNAERGGVSLCSLWSHNDTGLIVFTEHHIPHSCMSTLFLMKKLGALSRPVHLFREMKFVACYFCIGL